MLKTSKRIEMFKSKHLKRRAPSFQKPKIFKSILISSNNVLFEYLITTKYMRHVYTVVNYTHARRSITILYTYSLPDSSVVRISTHNKI